MAFNRNNRSGGGNSSWSASQRGEQGGRDFGRRSFGGDRGGDRQMFKTTCSNCGKECEVPFKPTGSRPVYCSDCFRTMGGPDSRNTDDRDSRRPNFENRDRGSAQPQYREQFETLNVKLDRILKLLNPERSVEAPKVVAKPKIEDVKNGVENVEPVKKKIKAKKLTPTEDAVEVPLVIKAPIATGIPTKTPTE